MNVKMPTLKCNLCLELKHCKLQGFKSADLLPYCFVQNRAINLNALQDFLKALRSLAELDDKRLLKLEELMLAHLQEASKKYSNTLEFSISSDKNGLSAYRYSYSFPGLGFDDTKNELASCRDFYNCFSKETKTLADKLLSLSNTSKVQQILFGIDASRAIRFKIYYQFENGLKKEKLKLLSKLIDVDCLKSNNDSYDRLHLIGLDFNERGVFRLKLYFLYPKINSKAISERFGAMESLNKIIKQNNLACINDFLVIRRIDMDGEDLINEECEVDFSLIKNELSLADIEETEISSQMQSMIDSFKKLGMDHNLLANRLSLATNSDKANIYYLYLSEEN